MHTQALRLIALLGISTLAAAQDPASQDTPAAAAGPSFRESDDIPSLKGFSDAYSLSEIRLGGAVLSEQQQIDRWKAELGAGRARAGALLGAYLAYRALSAADCAAARAPLLKADELGSDQAPWLLGQLAANNTCGAEDRAEVERWLEKAVPLDYPGAAPDLMRLYAQGDTPTDKFRQYVYARVSAGYWESTHSPQPRTGFDAAALVEMEKSLTAADRSRAEAEAAKILEAMLKRHERFGDVDAQAFARGEAGAKTAFVAYHSDYRHECAWNLQGNCRGAQRLAYVELTNKNSEFVSCKLQLQALDFVTDTPVADPLTREVVVGPQASRKLLLGDVNVLPAAKAMSAVCKPVPRLAANAAAGKCRAKLEGGVDVARFYPESARSRGIEGSTVVRYWVPPGGEAPTDAEISASSGDASLDAAAMATVRSGKFTRECDYGLGIIRIAFKLEK